MLDHHLFNGFFRLMKNKSSIHRANRFRICWNQVIQTYITPDTNNAKVISMGFFFIQVSFYTLCWYILFTNAVFAYMKHHHFRTEGKIFIDFAYADDISLMRLDCWFTNSDANIKWSSVDLQILIIICYEYSCPPWRLLAYHPFHISCIYVQSRQVNRSMLEVYSRPSII